MDQEGILSLLNLIGEKFLPFPPSKGRQLPKQDKGRVSQAVILLPVPREQNNKTQVSGKRQLHPRKPQHIRGGRQIQAGWGGMRWRGPESLMNLFTSRQERGLDLGITSATLSFPTFFYFITY